jgi:microcompartment protein CcmL/EutN
VTAVAAASRGPALGLLEVATIARGVVVADAALKRSPALLLHSRAVSGGKHVIVLEGGVAEVDEAVAAGRLAARDQLLAWLLLPQADVQVWPMLGAPVAGPDWSGDDAAEAVAIVESQLVCGAIAAADAACKVAEVVVRDVRLAVDLAGKGYFTLTGSLGAIEAAAAAAAAAVDGTGTVGALAALEVIAQPAPDLRGRLFR